MAATRSILAALTPMSTEFPEVLKAEVKAEVFGRIQFIVNDCATIRYARNTEWYRDGKGDQEKPGFGGGNFLMAHGLFSALNFLAKVHTLVTEPIRFTTSKENSSVKEVLAKLKAQKATLKEGYPDIDWKLLIEYCKPPRVGECNEKFLFRRLIKLIEPSIRLGIGEVEADEVWENFRNKLAHMASPSSTVVVFDGFSEHEKSFPPFRRVGLEWHCNVDRLSQEIQKIAQWVCQGIDQVETKYGLWPLANWIRGHDPTSNFLVSARNDNAAAAVTSTTQIIPSPDPLLPSEDVEPTIVKTQYEAGSSVVEIWSTQLKPKS